jgi:hypothetical protein
MIGFMIKRYLVERILNNGKEIQIDWSNFSHSSIFLFLPPVFWVVFCAVFLLVFTLGMLAFEDSSLLLFSTSVLLVLTFLTDFDFISSDFLLLEATSSAIWSIGTSDSLFLTDFALDFKSLREFSLAIDFLFSISSFEFST